MTTGVSETSAQSAWSNAWLDSKMKFVPVAGQESVSKFPDRLAESACGMCHSAMFVEGAPPTVQKPPLMKSSLPLAARPSVPQPKTPLPKHDQFVPSHFATPPDLSALPAYHTKLPQM